MDQLQKIAAFVASHEMPMVRVSGDAVEFATECVQVTSFKGQPDPGARWCEITAVRSMTEARSALGY